VVVVAVAASVAVESLRIVVVVVADGIPTASDLSLDWFSFVLGMVMGSHGCVHRPSTLSFLHRRRRRRRSFV
jgi:hypothetical protein